MRCLLCSCVSPSSGTTASYSPGNAKGVSCYCEGIASYGGHGLQNPGLPPRNPRERKVSVDISAPKKKFLAPPPNSPQNPSRPPRAPPLQKNLKISETSTKKCITKLRVKRMVFPNIIVVSICGSFECLMFLIARLGMHRSIRDSSRKLQVQSQCDLW